MHEDKTPRDDLPDELGDIVAGIVARPAPDDIKERVRSRLKDQLYTHPVSTNTTPYVALAIGTLAVAATIAAIVYLRPSTPESTTTNLVPTTTNVVPTTTNLVPTNRIVVPAPTQAIPARRPSTEGPSLWAYHRAANDSPEQLDGLLARHARLVLTSTDSVNHRIDLSATSRSLEEF